ncbi:MAG TPA: fibronectin type III domain-containing protein, partial [Candidatus Paceibacterota bacterium]|nr:fibronectin type III domain-containing protein [Candidatus Paceibacterota bacterium]
NRFGQATISWLTDEPASSVLRYGTNASISSLTLGITNAVRTTTHSVDLRGLVAGRTYYFLVASTDEAGNTGTNSNGGALFSFTIAPVPPVLLVDEYQDPLFDAPPLSGYTDALNQIGVGYDVWDVGALGEPTPGTLQPYRAVIWRVPELTGAWSATERSAISNYLHGGGSLFVASMEIFSRLSEAGGASFITDVLQVQSYITDPDSTGAAEVIGSGGAIGNGLDIVMDYTPYDNVWGGALGPDLSDTFTPTANASPIFHNDFQDIVGLRWPAIGKSAPGRLVLFSFPLDAVPLDSSVNGRANLLKNVLSFLAPGASALADITLSSPAYSIPAQVAVEVGDSDQAGKGTLSISAYTTTQTNRIAIVLSESATRGVFTGSFEIISATNAAVAGKLHAANGDTLTVEYADASSGETVSANAEVDAVAPVISAVAATPAYEEAVVSWDTSELADSLVQFGESTILNRTAYGSGLTTAHELTLPGLAPNRIYYYQVVSRDAAGNVAVDDNHGQLYTFQTLTPLPV